MERSKRLGGMSYEGLCMYPNVEFPKGFEIFNGIGDPKAHLGCNKTI